MHQTSKTWQMRPGLDNVSTMAAHYGLKPSKVRDIIKQAGAELIRHDGHRGRLVNLTTHMVSKTGGAVEAKLRSVVWDDCQPFDPASTRLTRQAIKAVAKWAFENSSENPGDN